MSRYIKTDAYRMESSVKPPMAVTNAVSWRVEGIRHKKNEVSWGLAWCSMVQSWGRAWRSVVQSWGRAWRSVLVCVTAAPRGIAQLGSAMFHCAMPRTATQHASSSCRMQGQMGPQVDCQPVLPLCR
jgi:hypothetical protein